MQDETAGAQRQEAWYWYRAAESHEEEPKETRLIRTSATPRALPAALFFVTATTVMFQVLLTRVFSLTMWYHFAFMAISMAMLGLTVGALAVFLRPAAWPESRLARSMGRCAVLCALSMAGVILAHSWLYIPNPWIDFWPMAWTFASAAVPFAFSGVFVCHALTRFPSQIGQLYAVDLAGAAVGCLGVIAALTWLDGVGAVLCCAALAALAGVLLLQGRERIGAAGVCALLAAAALWSGIHLAWRDLPAIPIHYMKWSKQPDADYERWNSFSRIAVLKPDVWYSPAWSLSPAFTGTVQVPTRNLIIDAGAGTTLIGFDGDLGKIDFLRWDLVNFAHHLRRDARVAIVGSGAGRDILTARVFGQKGITAIEINGNILDVVNGPFGSFTGHLDRDPMVTLVHDEARSYLARSSQRFDIVQLTFIDTWAATAAGAYVLTENSLYTREAWQIFLDRLDDNGLLAVARGLNSEIERMVSLGQAALRANGATQPERHMVLVVNRTAAKGSFGPMGILLVRKTPFPEDELARVREVAKQMKFQVELQPGQARNALMSALASGRGMEELLAQSIVNYDPPTDDQPFFFNMLRVRSWFGMRDIGRGTGQHSVTVLVDLLAGVAVLTLLSIGLPLVLARVGLPRGGLAHLAFFAAIGAGFMLVEISMLQRLIIFLGHPIYSLSVILFVLLLASGLGARLSTRVADSRLDTAGIKSVALLAVVLVAAGFATGPLVAAFQDAETPVRIAISSALLALMGIPMGMAFPLGMRLAMRSHPRLTPWLWGVNGAMSVLASVLAVVIALAWGISASYWTGAASYALAAAAFAAASRRSVA